MSNEIYDIVKDYVIKNPDLNYTEIADLILEDEASKKSHRTLRRYASEVKDELTSGQLSIPFADEEDDFMDLTELDLSALTSTANAPTTTLPTAPEKPKILILDIETARMIFGAWSCGKQYLGPDQVIKDYFILGYSCKWLFSSEILSDFVTSEEAKNRDDARICESLWCLMDEAQIIVSHNGSRFDLPKINSRFLVNGLVPPSPYESVDTCKIASKQFGFSSNALNFIGKLLLDREKIHTNYQLWINCENGEEESLKFMETYCRGDVTLLESVYLTLLPYIKSHPNIGVLMEATVPTCPNCGSTKFFEDDEYTYSTPQNLYEAVRCAECGAINRKRVSKITTAQRENLLVPIAR